MDTDKEKWCNRNRRRQKCSNYTTTINPKIQIWSSYRPILINKSKAVLIRPQEQGIQEVKLTLALHQMKFWKKSRRRKRKKKKTSLFKRKFLIRFLLYETTQTGKDLW